MSAAPPPLRIGIAGYGVMGKAHSYGYRVAPMLRRLPVTPMITVMSGRDAAAVAAAASAYGIPVTVTDWRELIGRDDVDMVDICTPPGTHAQIAAAAAAAGKAVLCEKPLALTYAEAAGALTAVTRAGVHNAVGFDYRRLPAIALMRRMIADLGSHLIDIALCMAGPVDSVCAQAVTFIGDRPSGSGSGTTKVTVDDAASALLRFESGARGTMEVARAAVRRPCDFTVEVNGSRGTLLFSYARLNELWYAGRTMTSGCTACAGSAPNTLAPVRGAVVADRPGCRLRLLVRQPDRRPAGGLAGRAVESGIPRRRRGPGGVRRDGNLGRLRPLGQRQRGARQPAVTCAECLYDGLAVQRGTVYDIGRFTPARFAGGAPAEPGSSPRRGPVPGGLETRVRLLR